MTAGTEETSQDGQHLSIGEVLTHLRDEFPDVTISKIRFLESQGLIDPERTPSGYRKFYDHDLRRLRWILYQQREHFLPLKVIKERLEQAGPDGPLPAVEKPAVPLAAPAARTPRARRKPAEAPRLPLMDLLDDAGEQAQPVARGEEDADSPEERDWLSTAELAEASGLTVAQVEELQAFGLLVPILQTPDQVLFGADALAAARAAAGFARHGIEARHLRMYQHFADREAGVFAQVLRHYLRQRNPDARRRLEDDIVELARLGRALRAAMLHRALQDTLGS